MSLCNPDTKLLWQRRSVAMTCFVFLIGSFGCSKTSSERNQTSTDAAMTQLNDAAPDVALIRVEENQGLLFGFFDDRGELRTVETIEAIHPWARSAVLVTSPKERLSGDKVYVADVRQKTAQGTYRVWVESRGAWLDRLMPKVTAFRAEGSVTARDAKKPSRRTSSQQSVRKRRGDKIVTRISTETATRAQTRVEVVMYGTAWCPACRNARTYFATKQIPFADYDVERDASAADELRALQQKHQLGQGIPVIVVKGRVFQGFNPTQMDAVLAFSGVRNVN